MKIKPGLLLTLIIAVAVTGCSQKQTTEEDSSENGAGDEAKLGAEADLKEGQIVYFVSLKDGDQVTSPVKVEMGVEGMDIEPAGEPAVGKGHHHILIQKEYIDKGVVVPTDSMHLHFGLGQTEAEVELPPGTYTLSLQFADGFHRSYGQQMSQSISITVVGDNN